MTLPDLIGYIAVASVAVFWVVVVRNAIKARKRR